RPGGSAPATAVGRSSADPARRGPEGYLSPMTIVLTTHADSVAVEIEDHAGECFLYVFTVLAGPGWTVKLEKIEGDSDIPTVVYTVSNPREDRWECSCPDWRYRHRARPFGCKHISHMRELKNLLAVLRGLTQEVAHEEVRNNQ